MELESVKQRVAAIARDVTDNESAHGQEDELYLSVLRAIAEGHPDAGALAREALKAGEIEFTRWYA